MEDQKFKVGERVWFQPLGWGVVDQIESDSLNPVHCQFKFDHNCWCGTGELVRGCGIQSLFRANSGVLEFDTTELPDWPKNYPIWVRYSSKSRWVKRHLSHFENGFAFCFLNGLSDHTAGPGARVERWRNYTDVDPNKEGE